MKKLSIIILCACGAFFFEIAQKIDADFFAEFMATIIIDELSSK